MARLRAEKLQELMKQEISKIIQSDLKDPRVQFVTVTEVIASDDLRSAKIYVSLYGEKDKQKSVWQGLERSLGFIRSEIGKRIRLRFVPELSLHEDTSLAYSEHIQKILLDIKESKVDEK